jgi:hypothetical protein
MKMMISRHADGAAIAAHSPRQSRPSVAARVAASAVLLAALICTLEPAQAQFKQQGTPLVGSTTAQPDEQGFSVSLSNNGNTAIIGGPTDAGGLGAAWIFTRSAGVWTQLGNKLVGTGQTGTSVQGTAVAVSGDGNTAIVGGRTDAGNVGAVWVYTLINGVWTQQGNKLVSIDYTGGPQQGWAVGLSYDGNTAVVGGPRDDSSVGAVWVYTRSNGVWTQQGAKLIGFPGTGQQGISVAISGDGHTLMMGGTSGGLGASWVFILNNGVWTQQGGQLVGTGYVGTPVQGSGVSLSYDGNTAAIGGNGDSSGVGASWVFTRSNGVWSQQGGKLVGTNAAGASSQGASVSLSSDGNTLIVGGYGDNGATGATWVFARNNGVWTQLGNKLVGTGASVTQQGWSVSLSGDGNTALVGASGAGGNGASWVFARNNRTNTHDFNDDGYSDIVWRDGTGDIAFWLMNGATISSFGVVSGVPSTWSIVGQRDFNGDGVADLLWYDTSGDIAMWFMNGGQVASVASVGTIPNSWSVVGVADFNGDGLGDILWRDSSGNVAVWLMNSGTIMASAGLGGVPSNWMVVGTGDFNGDGKADILWQDNLGNVAIWFMNGTALASTASVANVTTSWSVAGIGDFNGDGKSDIAWRDNTGNTAIWLMNGAAISSVGGLGNVPTTWSIVQTGDYNGDGMSDLLWQDNLGNTAMWFMNGTAVASTGSAGNVPTNWIVQSAASD